MLISQIGDSRSLADNMNRLLEDADLATLLRNNAYESRRHSSNNEEIARHYLDAYIACLDHKMKGIPISDTLTVL